MMENDVLLAIEKNLPSQVAGALKQYIEKSEKLEKALEDEKTKKSCFISRIDGF